MPVAASIPTMSSSLSVVEQYCENIFELRSNREEIKLKLLKSQKNEGIFLKNGVKFKDKISAFSKFNHCGHSKDSY